jgi:3-dehydroquinate synthetase
LCELYELPTSVSFDVDEICERMLQDKKRRSQQLQFALPSKVGKVDIVAVNINEIKKYISDLRFT